MQTRNTLKEKRNPLALKLGNQPAKTCHGVKQGQLNDPHALNNSRFRPFQKLLDSQVCPLPVKTYY